ncbi:replicative DNA helicase [Mycoplasma iguanae]|uniref:Replicative DNA helicase n=1 Tax=Mycoplasma iguanae TaxID=292461 RepID=A0ABY5R9U2_9MOLU|nr:replicative DNA helicase [Mycoplasma iguanae]UVD81755.1 replicative DNA helicase [Mycoplasma iguanae]
MNNSNLKNLDLEYAVLGYILLNPENLEKFIIYLDEEIFSDPFNKEVFKAVKYIHDQEKHLEDNLIYHYLRQNNKFDFVGGEKFIYMLKIKAGLESNILTMIQELDQIAKKKKVAQLSTSIYKQTHVEGIALDQLIDEFEKKLLEIINNKAFKDLENIEEISYRVLEEIKRRSLNPNDLKGLPTSIGPLDQYTSGLQKGDLIIVAARPSMGKTAFALNLAVNAAKNDPESYVVFFSLEMASNDLATRMLSTEAAVPGNYLKEPAKLKREDMVKLSFAQKRLAEFNILIDDDVSITLSEMYWKLKRLKKTVKNISLIVIDYLQLISITKKSNNNENRQIEVSKISRTLKQIARELEVPVIALSQLSRNVEKREDKMPILSDLRESGAIEQDADIILFLYREEYYNKNKTASNSNTKQDVIINIAKHRNGPTGKFILDFEPSRGQFTEKADSQTKGDDF